MDTDNKFRTSGLFKSLPCDFFHKILFFKPIFSSKKGTRSVFLPIRMLELVVNVVQEEVSQNLMKLSFPSQFYQTAVLKWVSFQIFHPITKILNYATMV